MKLLMIVTVTILIALFLILCCQTPQSVYMNSKDCSLSNDSSYYMCYYVKDGKVPSYKNM